MLALLTMFDPAKMNDFLNMIKSDAADAQARGETGPERILREKMEWAQDDALSAHLKELVSLPAILLRDDCSNASS